MLKTFKYRLYPTNGQTTALNAALDACRFVYNKILEFRKNSWEYSKLAISQYDCNNYIVSLKKEHSFLENTYSQTLQQVSERVDLAFKSFFRRVKNKETPGYPRFKGKGHYDSFTYTQSGFSLKENGKLRLSPIGEVKIILHRPIKGTIKRLTIQKTVTGKWFACFQTDTCKETLPLTNKTVGVDLGLESIATFSDGTQIENPRYLKKSKHRVEKFQRKISKIENKQSPVRKRYKDILAKIYEKIVNQRNDFSHKFGNKLVKEFDIIVFENLNTKGLKEKNGWKPLKRSLQDMFWGKIVEHATYKAESAGKVVILVNPRNTSKMCSGCGVLVSKDLSVRIHECGCGLRLHRDHNAAINIMRLGLESLQGASGASARSPDLQVGE